MALQTSLLKENVYVRYGEIGTDGTAEQGIYVLSLLMKAGLQDPRRCHIQISQPYHHQPRSAVLVLQRRQLTADFPHFIAYGRPRLGAINA